MNWLKYPNTIKKIVSFLVDSGWFISRSSYYNGEVCYLIYHPKNGDYVGDLRCSKISISFYILPSYFYEVFEQLQEYKLNCRKVGLFTIFIYQE